MRQIKISVLGIRKVKRPFQKVVQKQVLLVEFNELMETAN